MKKLINLLLLMLVFSQLVSAQNTLDKVGLSSANPAQAAYSLRLLSSGYSGAAIQVRRSNDNTTQDIGFTAGGDLDTVALIAFVGSDNGFVSIWYDQSGYGNNVFQNDINLQPRIVNAGVVDRNSAGQPAVYFPGNGFLGGSNGFPVNSDYTVSLIVQQNSTATNGTVLSSLNGQGHLIRYDGSTTLKNWHNGDFVSGPVAPLSNVAIQTVSFMNDATPGCTIYTNGLAGTRGFTGNRNTDASIELGAWAGNSLQLTGYISEAIVLPSVLTSTDQQNLEGNQQNFYGVTFITTQPSTSNQTLAVGAAATAYSVTATGPNLTYQWYSNTSNSNTGGILLAGANSSSYTPSTALSGVLYYYVVVGSSNSSFTVTSTVSGFVSSISTLDKTSLSAGSPATAAYSLRLLSSSYPGVAIQVRRSSDNALQDIGFTASGDLDTLALLAFAGSGNAFVNVWYDQSGYNNNIFQNDINLQPRIVNAGEVDRNSAGQPAVYFPGNGFLGGSNGFPVNSDYTVSLIVQQNTTATNGTVLSSLNGRDHLIRYDGTTTLKNWHNGDFVTGPIAPLSTVAIQTVSFSNDATPGCTIYTNGLAGTRAYTGNRNTDASIDLGAWSGNGLQLTGYISEAIVLPSVLTSTDQQNLEGNQQNFYGVAFITSQPSTSSQTLAVGAAATAYSVTATGPNLTYQWYSNTSNSNIGGILLAGANSSSYTPSTALSGVLYYYVVVGSSNSGFAVTSTVSGFVSSIATLDKTGLSSGSPATAAYSLRQLSSSNTGAAIEVRRSSDNALQNIGFTAGGDLDTVALQSFIGVESGFVSIWYDQSGYGNNVFQNDINLQPRIVNAGVVDRNSAGQPAVYFPGNGFLGGSNGFPVNSDYTVSLIVQQNSTATNGTVISALNGRDHLIRYNSSTSLNNWHNGEFVNGPSAPLNSVAIQTVSFLNDATPGCTIYTNGLAGTKGYTGNRNTEPSIELGGFAGNNLQLTGYISEAIVLPSVLTSTDQQNLEGNQAANFNISAINFTAQPTATPQAVCLNGTVSPFSVAAIGIGTFSYQWYKNTASDNVSGTPIAGATSDTYTPDISVAGTTYYYAILTASNGTTKATTVSGPIIVEVAPVFSVTPLNPTIVNGDSVLLTASGASSYVWGKDLSNPISKVSGAKMAVALRRLSASYSGPAIRLRRESDNAEADFGFNNNDLDLVAINTFLGGSNGRCVTLYDQSGNGNNMAQSNPGQQPLLVIAGINGKPVIQVVPGTSLFNYTNYPKPYTVVYAARQTGPSRGRVLSGVYTNWLLGFWNGDKNKAYFEGWVSDPFGSPADSNPYVYSATSEGSTSSFYQNGILSATNGNGTGAPNGLTLNGSESSDAEVTELFVFNTKLNDDDRSFIENSTGNYYGIIEGLSKPGSTFMASPTVTTLFKVIGYSANKGCAVYDSSLVRVHNSPNLGNFTSVIKTTYDSSFKINNPSSKGTGAFTFTSSNPAVATIQDSIVTIIGEGVTTILATQAEDATYYSDTISTTLTVKKVIITTKSGEITSTKTDYVNKNGELGGNTGLNKNGAVVITKYTNDGLSPQTAATSAQQIKVNFPASPDGKYWIKFSDGSIKQIYCIMNSAVDGGGWMMMMKTTAGNTFNYDSPYWTSNNTLNETDATRNDGDAKYETMNKFEAKDMLALWPDIASNFNSSTTGGSINLAGTYNNWSWLQNNFNGGTAITPVNFFATADRLFISDAEQFTGKGTAFSGQSDVRFYGFNFRNNPGWAKTRWGFGWNENGGGLYPNGNMDSDDVSGGIGMSNNFGGYSAGDRINCCQNSVGINRAARVEIYVR